ncbi:aminotransferase [Sphingobacterium griseoflavum]|uniref:Aminotransferase n=2 Tax=Sphingobacterium griseoflavum TaxID=1474952 RepID=A0ABQ3HWW6_9SPHI|nr:aminotransferase [Sphingobacterium griseoflavum]
MSALATQHGAVNLSQGFPNYPVSAALIALVDKYMEKGWNQYAPMPGCMPLREQIAQKVSDVYAVAVHPESEVTITAGATQALFTAMATVVQPGDEVIIFEPAYDSYRPSVEVFGGKVVPVRLLAPDFAVDWQEVRAAITKKTKLIIVNNPGNPSTKIWTDSDWKQLQQILQDNAVFLLSDEVYEHIVFDGQKHKSVLSYPALRERSWVVASFGKLLHTTGWKLGYVIAPPLLTQEFRKVHQFNVFSVNTPMQMAIAEYLKDSSCYLDLPAFMQEKRDFLVKGLLRSRFSVVPSEGTYFLLAGYQQISGQPEREFAQDLTINHGVATVPVAAFYSTPCEQKLVRICFAKDGDTLSRAVELLQKV